MEEFLASSLPFWKHLSQAEKQLVVKSAQIKQFPKNTILYHAGSDHAGLKLVRKGQIRIFLTSKNGSEITLFRLTDGDLCIISVMCMIKKISPDINMAAEKDSEIYVIPASFYTRVLSQNSHVRDFNQELLFQRFSDIMNAVEDIAFSSNEKKLADALIKHCELENTSLLTITHETLAKDIGTAREVVSRTLKRFEELGLVELFRGKIQVLNIVELRGK